MFCNKVALQGHLCNHYFLLQSYSNNIYIAKCAFTKVYFETYEEVDLHLIR